MSKLTKAAPCTGCGPNAGMAVVIGAGNLARRGPATEFDRAEKKLIGRCESIRHLFLLAFSPKGALSTQCASLQAKKVLRMPGEAHFGHFESAGV
jgi:hypothetical protein